jgi:hypothetical protein
MILQEPPLDVSLESSDVSKEHDTRATYGSCLGKILDTQELGATQANFLQEPSLDVIMELDASKANDTLEQPTVLAQEFWVKEE